MIELDAISKYGLYALIPVLGGVIVYVYSELKAERLRNDDLQGKRVEDAQKTQSAIVEPINGIVNVNKQMYDLLIDALKDRRK